MKPGFFAARTKPPCSLRAVLAICGILMLSSTKPQAQAVGPSPDDVERQVSKTLADWESMAADSR